MISTPEYDVLINGMDKFESTNMVAKFGLKTPKTYTLQNFDSNDFPVYIKSRLSWVVKDDKFNSGFVKKIKSHHEFLNIKNELNENEVYVQEEVSGVGWGFEILARDGELLNYFAHERIRESNPKGGYSSVAKSIYPNPHYKDSIEKILKELNWTGVAMFEFKGDYRETQSYFIEMNCRFWGSLPVALHSGNRFPYLLLQVLENKKVEQIDYKEHVFAQWYQADIIHFFKILVLKNRSQYNLPSVYKTFKSVFFSKMKNYNNYRGDWKPNFYELTKGFAKKIL
jgi:predicted ATP-grasp superfamily ATP-dependent carboligase